MVILDCVANRIIKNNINIRSEKNMNKYALLNSDEEFATNDNIDNELLEDIMLVCDADNIFKYSEFEVNELKFIKETKGKFVEDDKSNSYKIIEEFIDKNTLNSFKVKISEIKKQMKRNIFKKFFLEQKKRQNILNCDIKKSVENGKLLQDLADEQNQLKKEYDDCVVQINKINLESFENYEKMLQTFVTNKQVEKSIQDIANKYSIEILKVYLTRKIVYLIYHNFDARCLPEIINTLENSERFRNNFELVVDSVLETLKCGNK